MGVWKVWYLDQALGTVHAESEDDAIRRAEVLAEEHGLSDEQCFDLRVCQID